MVGILQKTNEEQRGGLKEEIRMELTPGSYTISIQDDPASSGREDIQAWLWFEGSDSLAIENPKTGASHSCLWHTLTGCDDQLSVCIHQPVTIHALCLERSGYKSKGGIKVRYLPLPTV